MGGRAPASGGRLPPAAVLVMAAIVPLLALIPTWQGYHFEQPPDRVFLGFRYMPGDHYQYAGFIREGMDGAGPLMPNPFTSDTQSGVFFLPYFWITGVLTRLTGMKMMLVWEALRLVGGVVYLLVFWEFAGRFFDKRGERLFAMTLFSFAGGLDWIVTLLRLAGLTAIAPLEYAFSYHWNWSTFGLMQVPHWIWPAMILTLASSLTLGKSSWRQTLVFLLVPWVWFLHAYSGMVAYLTFGLLPIVPLVTSLAQPSPVPWKRIRSNLQAALPVLLSFAVVAGYLLWARSDAVFRANSERGFTWTNMFPLWWYPLSYGLLLFFAWFGLKQAARDQTLRSDLLLAWLGAAVLLSANTIYAGVKFQYLVFPPLVLLAARGALYLKTQTRFGARAAKSGAVMSAAALLLFLNAPVSLVKDYPAARKDADIYGSAGEMEAMKFLEGQPDGPVLSTYRNGNRIPWLAGKRVFIGHWFMTPDLDTKGRMTMAVFSNEVPIETRKALLLRTGARYVYVSPSDGIEALDSAGLPVSRLYDSGGYVVYAVTP